MWALAIARVLMAQSRDKIEAIILNNFHPGLCKLQLHKNIKPFCSKSASFKENLGFVSR